MVQKWDDDMYIIVTPAKNEEEHLPKVAEAVITQNVPPILWVIVDDGSTDRTPDIIRTLEDQYIWIKSIQLPPHPRDITFHYSYVCKSGFDYAIQLCKTNAIQYNFIGLLDADTVLEAAYFEKLSMEFHRNSQLGIASGHITDMSHKEVRWADIKNDEPDRPLPRGSGRFWAKKCFFETGGYPIEPSPDSISNVKANLRRWEIRQFGHIRAIQLRGTSGAQGLWNGYRVNGSMAHYLNKHPLLVLVGSFFYSTQKPYYIGLAYLYGYLLEWLKRSPKINDPEIRDYYWNKRLKEYIKLS
ncbi:glycosyltransferase [Methanoculleus sp. UBA303]|uniref:glycosyltransferase n=1 Tax=Methanoculleus sp. UBA303 TaxID=1915497 RepID=UPI0025D4B1FD|nr:glycosyltransferase [Methanoculleus sp. UBA303]